MRKRPVSRLKKRLKRQELQKKLASRPKKRLRKNAWLRRLKPKELHTKPR